MRKRIAKPKVTIEERMRILANHMLDRIYDDYAQGSLRFTSKTNIIKSISEDNLGFSYAIPS